MRDVVPVKRGRNVWLLLRTDRDAAQTEDVLRSAPFVLERWLRPASPLGLRSVRGPCGIGAARNVRADVVSGFERSTQPLARFEDCPALRQVVVARAPWFVRAAFDWHGSDTLIPWPRLGLDTYGSASDNDQALDWLLLEACSGAGAGVGAPEPTPAGFVPVFAGWNVWDVYQKDDLDFELGMAGVSRDRRLRIWIENAISDGAPGAAVADNLNPAVLKGSQIEIIESPGDLQVVARKESVPGPALLLDGPATVHTVRFYNRGNHAALSWPHDSNYLLNAAYAQSATSPITSAPPPSSLGGAVSGAVDKAKDAGSGILKAVAIGVGAVAVAGVVFLAFRLTKGKAA